MHPLPEDHNPSSSFPSPLGTVHRGSRPPDPCTTWRMSFVAAARLFSLTPGRVLRLFARYVPLDLPWKGGEGEVILTMDALSFRGKNLVCVLGTLLPEDTQRRPQGNPKETS